MSVTTTRAMGEKCARFGSLFQIANWRPNKYPSRSVTAVATEDYKQLQSTAQTFGMGTATPNTRRSKEAMWYCREGDVSEESEESGNLTATRQASSWGQSDKEFTEMVSVQSVEHGLNEQEMNVGVAGMFHDVRISMSPSLGPASLARLIGSTIVFSMIVCIYSLNIGFIHFHTLSPT
ncbi:hypothetical protein BDZ97DRAFT_120331 [Flammula alnicola]|nr:hypothetical protein BDZ97DRAFT_694739 [Flammula alnicola]KAF8957101.1 hypothetical protein BDZ97DRAFT_120331 [Flammula alnicola]